MNPLTSLLRHSPLCQLVLARIREFFREPEAVFWGYGFPLLMAMALGFAFRNKPVEQFTVDLLAGNPAGLDGDPAGRGHRDGRSEPRWARSSTCCRSPRRPRPTAR